MSNRSDTYRVTVDVDGQPSGVWDKMSGGEADSEETKFKPGGLAPEVSLGGSSMVGNVTVSRLYDLNTVHNSLVRTLMAGVGKLPIVVTKQPINALGVAVGNPLVYRGMLKSCTPPDHDSESSDAALIEIEVSVEGNIG